MATSSLQKVPKPDTVLTNYSKPHLPSLAQEMGDRKRQVFLPPFTPNLMSENTEFKEAEPRAVYVTNPLTWTH